MGANREAVGKWVLKQESWIICLSLWLRPDPEHLFTILLDRDLPGFSTALSTKLTYILK